MLDTLLKLVDALGVKLGVALAIAIALAYWLTKDFFPWFRPHADDLLSIFKRRLAKDLDVERPLPSPAQEPKDKTTSGD